MDRKRQKQRVANKKGGASTGVKIMCAILAGTLILGIAATLITLAVFGI